jgi:hypothetical protein
MRARCWSTGAVLGLFFVLAPARAHAGSGQFLSVGILHSERYGEAGGFGNGVEVTLVDYRRRFNLPATDLLGVGGFMHLESVGEPGRLGFGGGLQLNYFLLGLEAGVDYVGPAEGLPERAGLYLGLFASVGFVALGWHAVVQVTDGSGPSQGYGHALTFALKVPVPFLSGNGWGLLHSGTW